jgi:hypothetical protein
MEKKMAERAKRGGGREKSFFSKFTKPFLNGF